jgi:hypothetical protein
MAVDLRRGNPLGNLAASPADWVLFDGSERFRRLRAVPA